MALACVRPAVSEALALACCAACCAPAAAVRAEDGVTSSTHLALEEVYLHQQRLVIEALDFAQAGQQPQRGLVTSRPLRYSSANRSSKRCRKKVRFSSRAQLMLSLHSSTWRGSSQRNSHGGVRRGTPAVGPVPGTFASCSRMVRRIFAVRAFEIRSSLSYNTTTSFSAHINQHKMIRRIVNVIKEAL